MRWADVISEAWRALQAHRFRSVLTILGIVIGVFAVSMMLALGQGVQDLIQQQIQAFSQGDVSVRSGGIALQERDLHWLQSQPYTQAVVATNQAEAAIVVAGKTLKPSVSLVRGPLTDVREVKVAAGELFDWNDPSLSVAVAVVDSTFAKKYQEETGTPAYPGTLTIRGQVFAVVGVLEASTGGFTFGDGTVYVPQSFAASLFGITGYQSAALKLKDKARYEVVVAHVQRGLNTAYGLADGSQGTFTVSSDQGFAEQEQRINFYFTMFLGAIGGIALLVGGIGTMNMMLTTVSERTKEIGLRKAVGAQDGDITKQVLCEAIILTGSGGLIGVGLTFLIAVVANTILGAFSVGFAIAVNPLVVTVSVTIAVLVGVVFGWSPAKQAARLPVVDALRAD